MEAPTSDGTTELLRPSQWSAKHALSHPAAAAAAAGSATTTTSTTTAADATPAASGAGGGAGADATAAPTGADVGAGVVATDASAPSRAPVVVADMLGHFVVIKPVLLTVAADKPPVATTLIFNSMGGDLTRRVATVGFHRMFFRGAHEESDTLYLHATHVSNHARSDGSWPCQACTFVNKAGDAACSVCGAAHTAGDSS